MATRNTQHATRKSVLIGLMLCLIVLTFTALSMTRVRRNFESNTRDQGAYLQLGLDIRARQALTDGNRQPLYPALMSLFAEREWAYFTRAKLLSLGLGLAVLIAVFVLTARLANADVALLATLLVAVGERFLHASSQVMVETLLTLLFFLTWYFVVSQTSEVSENFGSLPWTVAGLCAGLAYLAKGTGQLLLIAVVLTAVITHRRRALTHRPLWAFVLAYFAVASVLLVYNARVYGNPFYNINTAHVMWLDTWEEVRVADKSALPTALTYLRTHSLGDVVRREWHGLGVVWGDVVAALAPLRAGALKRFLDSWWGVLAVAVALGGVALHRRRRPAVGQVGNFSREKLTFTLTLFALSYGLFAWYAQVASGPRFWLPVVPIIAVFLAEMAYSLGRDVPLPARLKPWAYGAVYAGLGAWLLALGAAYVPHLLDDPFASDRARNADVDAVLGWLAEGVAPGTVVIYGPSHSLPTWKYSDRLAFAEIPSDLAGWDGLQAYLHQRGARWLILDSQMLVRRDTMLGGHFGTYGGQIYFKTPPAGWALAYPYRGVPCDQCIFKLLDVEPIQHPLSIALGDHIRLLGYDLDAGTHNTQHATRDTQHAIRLTLYWQATDEITADYTVFTHLLGPGGRVRGQTDSQPIRGLWPTSRWLPGQTVADRYELTLAADAPPGDYRLEVGMYLLETMERLPVAGDTSGQNAVVLGTITVTD